MPRNRALTIDVPGVHPVVQVIRKFSPPIEAMIATMIEKLKKVNFICKVKYHEWLENIFLVKKKNIQL